MEWNGSWCPSFTSPEAAQWSLYGWISAGNTETWHGFGGQHCVMFISYRFMLKCSILGVHFLILHELITVLFCRFSWTQRLIWKLQSICPLGSRRWFFSQKAWGCGSRSRPISPTVRHQQTSESRHRVSQTAPQIRSVWDTRRSQWMNQSSSVCWVQCVSVLNHRPDTESWFSVNESKLVCLLSSVCFCVES